MISLPILWFLGTVVGITLGLTGAGGALISIPLLVHLLDCDLKTATSLSLFSAGCGALLNWLFKFRSTQVSLALILLVTASTTIWVLAPFKTCFPLPLIQISLGAICIYSLYSLYFPRTMQPRKGFWAWALILFLGVLVGLANLLTGIGGGVIMMPFLAGVLGFNMPKALATSLLVTAIASLWGFALQMPLWHGTIPLSAFIHLAIGIFAGSLITDQILEKVAPKPRELLRKGVYTLVICLALKTVLYP